MEGKISQEATLLEGTVRRLVEETGSSLKCIAGVSYARALEGIKDGVEWNYHLDFDGYEAFTAKRDSACVSINNLDGTYTFALKNTGTRLLESARKKGSMALENDLDVRLLLSEELRKKPDSIHMIAMELQEAYLAAITLKMIKKYLS